MKRNIGVFTFDRCGRNAFPVFCVFYNAHDLSAIVFTVIVLSEDKKVVAEIVKVVFDVAKVLLGIGGTLSVGKLLHYIEENGFISLKDWQLMLNILRMGR